MWTADIYLFDRGPSPSERGQWVVACSPPPRPLQGSYPNGPDLEGHLRVRVPALFMTRPRSLRGTLLTNSFVTLGNLCDSLRGELIDRSLTVSHLG